MFFLITEGCWKKAFVLLKCFNTFVHDCRYDQLEMDLVSYNSGSNCALNFESALGFTVDYSLNCFPLSKSSYYYLNCIHCETFCIFIFSWQACSEQTILTKVVYFKVALQSTSDCVLGENGRCVLTYTAPALSTYKEFIVTVMLFYIMNMKKFVLINVN